MMTRRRLPFARMVLTVLALGGWMLGLGSCGGGGGGSGFQSTFIFAASSPAPLQLGVDRDVLVEVQFNKRLDPASVGAQSLVVVVESTGQTVAGSAALIQDGNGLTIRWTGTELLPESDILTCQFSTDLRSVDNEPLGAPFSYRFGTSEHTGNVDLPLPADLRRTTGRLNRGRQAHAAIRLNDGRVLVTGGYTAGEAITDQAEIFNPGTGTFILLSNRMVTGRAGHTMSVLPDGRILITGGYVQAAGGGLATTTTAELFNPGTLTFTGTGAMAVERADHRAGVLADGRILVTGGSVLTGNVLTDHATAEVYNPTNGQFTNHPSLMTHTRATHGMVDTGLGRHVMCGGSDQDFRHGWFDEADDRFEDLGEAAGDAGRFGPACAAFNTGNVIIAGGDLGGTVLHVNRASGHVQNTGGGLTRPRAFAAAANLGGDRIVVIGGIDFSRGNFIEGSMDVIVEGGPGEARVFSTAVRFNPPLAFHTATVLQDGRVLICGGLNADGTQPNLNDAYLLSP